MKSNNVVREKSFAFAIRVVKAYQFQICLILVATMMASCKDDCDCISPASCDTSFLTVCDSNSSDLQQFTTRRDERSLYGTAYAIKSVPDAGEIRWVANNAIGKVNGDYYLSMANYADTSWMGLEQWAYLRENVLAKFDPFGISKQQIFNESTYQQDSSVSYSRYDRWLDDYHNANWEIDESKDNFILVTLVDYENEIAEGEFILHFSMTKQSTLPGVTYSDKIIFKCGHFKSKISE